MRGNAENARPDLIPPPILLDQVENGDDQQPPKHAATGMIVQTVAIVSLSMLRPCGCMRPRLLG